MIDLFLFCSKGNSLWSKNELYREMTNLPPLCDFKIGMLFMIERGMVPDGTFGNATWFLNNFETVFFLCPWSSRSNLLPALKSLNAAGNLNKRFTVFDFGEFNQGSNIMRGRLLISGITTLPGYRLKYGWFAT